MQALSLFGGTVRSSATDMLIAWLGLASVMAGCNSNAGNAPSSGPPSSGTGTGDDTPDKPVPVSGAYLTCLVPEAKETDTQLYAGCQLRDKDHKRVDLSRAAGYSWSYVATDGNTNQSLQVADLAHAVDHYYFHVIYSLPVPAGTGTTTSSGTGTNTSGLRLTATSSRQDLIRSFLAAAPVLAPQARLMSQFANPNSSPRTATTMGTGLGLTAQTSSRLLTLGEYPQRAAQDPVGYGFQLPAGAAPTQALLGATVTEAGIPQLPPAGTDPLAPIFAGDVENVTVVENTTPVAEDDLNFQPGGSEPVVVAGEAPSGENENVVFDGWPETQDEGSTPGDAVQYSGDNPAGQDDQYAGGPEVLPDPDPVVNEGGSDPETAYVLRSAGGAKPTVTPSTSPSATPSSR